MVASVLHNVYKIWPGITWKLIANQFNSNETICLSFYATNKLLGHTFLSLTFKIL